jgi:hypothetical protein
VEGANDADAEHRVSPMGLVRYSRGGKSRALYEIEQYLRKHFPEFVVIHISFNDYSPLDPNEQDSPVEALCRRICFWFLQKRTDSENFAKEYRQIRDARVDPQAVMDYIGNEPCILLVDELNMMQDTSLLTNFLKLNFLIEKGRFFVFTSHVMSTKELLQEYMENPSMRSVRIEKLPIIESLMDAQQTLDFMSLTTREAIFCGLSPALIHTAIQRGIPMPITVKWENVIDIAVRQLCCTVVNGDYKLVPVQLLRYMDPVSNEKAIWVPLHLREILRYIVDGKNACSLEVLSYCREIAAAFDRFRSSVSTDGKGWESLFFTALLIRIVAQENHNILNIPFNAKSYTIAVGDFLSAEIKRKKVDITKIEDPKQYLSFIPKVGKSCHISIYRPQSPRFRTYDFFLVVWDESGRRQITGYQLKEGEEIPKNRPLPEVKRNFVIRGKPAQKESSINGWTLVSEPDISSFFGVSGANWTPMAWEKLQK